MLGTEERLSLNIAASRQPVLRDMTMPMTNFTRTLSSHGFKMKSCEEKPGHKRGHDRFEGLVERVGDRQPSKKHGFGW